MKNNHKILVAALGLALSATVAISQPTVTPAGDSLKVSGMQSKNGATLRVTGPDGYRYMGEIPVGGETTVDLTNTPFSEERLTALPEGNYNYELTLSPGGDTLRGSFTIGEPAAPVVMAASGDITLKAAVAADDLVSINDTDDDKTTTLYMAGKDSDGNPANWKLYNNQGTLRFISNDNMTNRFILTQGGSANFPTGSLNVNYNITTPQGRVGIGTTSPVLPLDIVGSAPTINLMDTDVNKNWKILNNDGDFVVARGDEGILIIRDGSPTNSLVITSAGVSVLSSRAAKTNIKSASAEKVLHKLEQLPIYTWSYSTDKSKAVHIGPMAEEFYATFGFGDDAKRISPLDTGGLALAGVKALQDELKQKDAEIAELKAKVDMLMAKLQ